MMMATIAQTQFAAAAENRFEIGFGPAGITSIRRSGDEQKAESLRNGASLGDVVLRFRTGTGPWQNVATAKLTDQRRKPDKGTGTLALTCDLGQGLTLFEQWIPRRDALLWAIGLRNGPDRAFQIGDLAVPLPMNTDYPRGFDRAEVKQEIFTRRLLRHAFISGDGSFLFWLPVGGVGPYLVMTPIGGTRLENSTQTSSDCAHGGGDYMVFIHSAASGAAETRGTWRQGHTSATLAPGEEVTYGFEFRWADDCEGIRRILFQAGGIDIRVAPDMVVPEDQSALIALRTRHQIDNVAAEVPGQTRIESSSQRPDGTHIYQLRFSRLGENRVTVRYGSGRHVHLEFFVTQPLETLIRKRAQLIAAKQHRDPSKWYDGLFSLWDVRMPEGRNLLGPDNLGGQHPYAVSGSDNWFINRFAKRDPLEEAVSRPGGPSQCRMWRTFDYTTYFALCFNMYPIARQNPGMVKYLDAEGCLRRAFGTARAFFEVPYNIRMEGGWAFTGWTDWTYTIGNFHEKYLLAIINSLEEEGLQDQADYLRGQREKKVKYSLYDTPHPFISEMPVDSTAYEST